MSTEGPGSLRSRAAGCGAQRPPTSQACGEELAGPCPLRLCAAQLLLQGLARAQPRPHPGLPQQVPRAHSHTCAPNVAEPQQPWSALDSECPAHAVLGTSQGVNGRSVSGLLGPHHSTCPPSPQEPSSLAAPPAALLLGTSGEAVLRVSLLLPRAAGASLSVKFLPTDAARRAAAPTAPATQGRDYSPCSR